ncbi:acyltransferase family protein [Corallococcus macrosporus]|uniref:Acyltransferase family protein n=1 Tax=Myxococcus fulvus (strain ATCC BAA-855 / HW-1) TaxID=483219 RepID=F8CJA8_MYXFH|nr:acyltransferase [Corallococcus macrosporus]AEI62621.1 acyltransferase family protein [Corallococcus macrosporus]
MPPASPHTLQACLDSRRNNLDFLRFAAAAGVLFSHAFPLGEGKGTAEPLEAFTRGQFSLGRLGVAVFLIISGVLITRSWERTPEVARFVWARALRIFPALGVMLLLTVGVLGPAFTRLPLGEYLTAPDTARYLLGNLALNWPQWHLPGVFESNAYPTAVNGSLWTLKYEVGFYLLTLGLGLTGLLRKGMVVFGLAGAAVATLVTGRLGFWPELYLYFGGGVALYQWRERVRMSAWVALACAAGWLVTARLGDGCRIVTGLLGGYVVLYLAFRPLGALADFGRRGDLSYGVYLYAFPVQQAVTALLGGRTAWWVNAAVALPCVLVLSALSWRWVEQPALRRKERLPRWARRPASPVTASPETPSRPPGPR